ncbi:RNA polymerase [Phytophthora megakarya]|uniref:RNA polymerase n=1 Tax=Phytophthora megakarya TaxID=4795 RepID=A0A225W043_9STRA|nr:RNA polymerase [Phytophthora megakarya]
MRTLVGFEQSRGSFFLNKNISRFTATTSAALFPELETWKQQIDAGTCEQPVSGGGFLQLLQYLRVVILLDAVILQQRTPTHTVWDYQICNSLDFVAFTHDLTVAMENGVDPAEQQLQSDMPLLTAKLDGVHQDLKSAMVGVRNDLHAVEGDLSEVMKVMTPLTAGSTFASTPSYRMSRGIRTVNELWTEWQVGLNGGFAVSHLENQFGTRWCGPDKRRFFNRRRKIIDLIRKGGAALSHSVGTNPNITREERLAIDKIESFRLERKKSLNWISSNNNSIAKELGF